MAAAYLAGYCVLIAAASLVGGWLPLVVRLTHRRMQLALSFVAGAMLGVGLLHLLPHAYFELRSIDAAVACLLGGFLAMFFLERMFHAHHHVAPDDAPEVTHAHAAAHAHAPAAAAHAHGPHCSGDHAHDDGSGLEPHDLPAPRLSWGAALLGLSLHGTLDGMALAAAVVQATSSDAHAGVLPGIAVFLAVLLHKPFDSLTLATLMAASGTPRSRRHLVNLLYATTEAIGVGLFALGIRQWAGAESWLVGGALAVAAGMFLCIASSDLLPELHFHTHDRFKLSAALLVGLALAAGLVLLESHGHAHLETDHGHHDHAHDTHDHGHGDEGHAHPH